ncbi:DUF1648 domain-containing protein [Paenibacillus nasutitermitis]|uniref:Membrane protein n=1 Tax=Paenibacillus nasutitermitis TaxID=1652958 RepID=A0A916ZDH2_9BACL|nr:DUF5808 domain-containing protein [Paenibacillus nasutitermitis]GGD87806.1 membrane protein [Paenibacillus nasutitermitis]
MDQMWGIWIFSIVMFLTMGAVFIFIPLASSRSLLFGVYVPEQYREDQAVREARGSYLAMAAIVMLCAAAVGGIVGWWRGEMSETVLLAATLVQIIGFVLAHAAGYRKALRFKQEKGWEAQLPQSKRVANLNFRKQPLTISNRWYLIPLLIVVISVVAAVIRWDSIPDIITTHYNARFEADGFSEKGFGSVFMLNMIQLLMIGLFLFTSFTIRTAKQQLDPAKPDESMMKQQKFRRSNSQFLYFLCLFIIVLFSYIQASMFYGWSEDMLNKITVFLPIVLIGSCIGFMVVLRKKGLDQQSSAAVSEDHHWKGGGIIYYNPDDPSIMVDKRLGVGWTMNMAHPVSWVVLGGILLLPVIIITISAIFG